MSAQAGDLPVPARVWTLCAPHAERFSSVEDFELAVELARQAWFAGRWGLLLGRGSTGPREVIGDTDAAHAAKGGRKETDIDQ